MNNDILKELTKILEARKNGGEADTSYVASLHKKGLNKILEKVGEECTETILAAKDAQTSGDTHDLIYETADLWFHSMVLLKFKGIEPSAVLAQLERRFGRSGVTEKAERAAK